VLTAAHCTHGWDLCFKTLNAECFLRLRLTAHTYTHTHTHIHTYTHTACKATKICFNHHACSSNRFPS
jgi:hypothetical protein